MHAVMMDTDDYPLEPDDDDETTKLLNKIDEVNAALASNSSETFARARAAVTAAKMIWEGSEDGASNSSDMGMDVADMKST
jgi:hypothetical protein